MNLKFCFAKGFTNEERWKRKRTGKMLMLGLFYVLKLISLFFVFGLLLCFEDQFVLCFISLITRGYVSNTSNISYIHNSYKYLSYSCLDLLDLKSIVVDVFLLWFCKVSFREVLIFECFNRNKILVFLIECFNAKVF